MLLPEQNLQHDQSEFGNPLISGRVTASVAFVGPGIHGRGGINAVLATYVRHECWKQHNCAWIESYDDRSQLHKVTSACKAWLSAPFRMWSRDVVHIHGSFRTSFMRKLPFIIAANLLCKKVVYHVHAPEIHDLGGASGALLKRVLTRVDCVIALSPSCALALQNVCPSARVVVVPNPVAIPALEGRCDDNRTVLFLGKLEPRKGFMDLIAAFRSVLLSCPDAHLVLGGHGDIEGARAMARQLGIESCVTTPGWVDEKEKAALLQRAALLCLPSYGEGLPIVLLEAMSYGVPVIATPVGGIPNVIADGVNGIIVPVGARASLSAQIVRLLRDAGLRARLGEEGRHTVERGYSSDFVWARLDEVYRAVLSRPPSHI